MKCNLVPASYRQDHRRWQRPACLALGLMLVVCAGAGLFFQYQIQREKAYYTDYLYPVQQQIQQRMMPSGAARPWPTAPRKGRPTARC